MSERCLVGFVRCSEIEDGSVLFAWLGVEKKGEGHVTCVPKATTPMRLCFLLNGCTKRREVT